MKSIDKVTRYDWAKPGDKGIDRMIQENVLKIDLHYQRGEVSRANTLSIARDFRWSAFGALIVMQRNNGDYYVVDGHQRLMAVRLRGDIKTVPCRVFESDGPEHEASAFIGCNINRSIVRAMPKFHAAVMAKEEPAAAISRWAEQNGFTVSDSSHVPNRIDFPSQLIKSWLRNSEASKRALLLQREIVGDELMHSYIHKGIVWLLLNGVDLEREKNKLIASGGKAAILRSIKAMEIQTNEKAGERLSGLGILSIINHKRRKRISI